MIQTYMNGYDTNLNFKEGLRLLPRFQYRIMTMRIGRKIQTKLKVSPFMVVK